MPTAPQDEIDARILTYYGELFDEDARLTTRSAQGALETQRTQEIIRSRVSTGTVLDVGGGTGRHALLLRDEGYDVELVDPVPRHVAAAREAGLHAREADARDLPFADDAFDVTLLLGPLYHLASSEHRARALAEAARVTRPGGWVFAAGLSRFIAFAAASLGGPVPDPYPAGWIALLTTGTPPEGLRFPAGHFHTAEELQADVERAGLTEVDVLGIEGPAGVFLEGLPSAETSFSAAALDLARAAGSARGIRDFSPHLLAVGRVPI